jgi:pyruvate-ferredoxin/flavodoxin oxidoreductase
MPQDVHPSLVALLHRLPIASIQESGHGPSWANSLFEDNAEYGFGFSEGVNAQRNRIADIMTKALDNGITAEEKEAFNYWLENKNNGQVSAEASTKVLAAIAGKTAVMPKKSSG